nr:MAG: hypothetical protein 2 [Tombusviridae sp.]
MARPTGRKKKQAPRVTFAASKSKAQELTKLGAALRALGGLGGGFAGNLIGQGGAGKYYGTGLGASLSRWLGSGDYTVASNSVVQRTLRGSDSIPSMHKSGQSISIQHREYLGPIKGSVGFVNQRFFTLQPGDSHTFPWLHSIATQFQQYRIKGMVVHYIPTSGEVVSGTNPAIGSVMIQTSYRASDTAPATKIEMLNEYWATESKPSQEFCHPIECSPKENPFEVHYVRSRPVPTGDSVMMYDMGNIFVATEGMPGANTVGDLWVTYDIELMKPQVLSDVAAGITYSAVRNVGGSTADLFGTAGLLSGVAGVTFKNGTVTFPTGNTGTFHIAINLKANTTFTVFNASGPVAAGCALVNMPGGMAAWRSTCVSPSILTEAVSVWAFTITDPSVSATVNFATSFIVGGTVAEVHCVVTQIA